MRPVYLLLILFLSANCLSQITFERVYGDSTSQIGASVLQTENGNYLIAGSYGPWSGYGGANRDLFLLKVNEQGDSIWSKKYFSEVNCDGVSIIEIPYNKYAVLSTSSDPFEYYNAIILLTNNDGDSLWSKTYEGMYATSFISTTDHGYIIGGQTPSDVLIIKTNKDGDIIWTTKVKSEPTRRQFISSLIEVPDEGYLLWCSNCDLNNSDCYPFLVKLDESGQTMWKKEFASYDYRASGHLLLNEENRIILTVLTNSGSTLLLETNDNGDTIWTKKMDNSISSIKETNDNGFIITGYKSGQNDEDAYLTKTDRFGETSWSSSFGISVEDDHPIDEGGICIIECQDHGFMVSAFRYSYKNLFDIYLIKTNENGIVYPDAIEENNKPEVVKISPNPNNGNFNLFLPEKTKKIEVYNIKGEKVYTQEVINNSTSSAIKVKLFYLLPGVYFLQVHSSSSLYTSRFMVY